MHSVKEKKKVSKKMAKYDKKIKMRYLLVDIANYFRWVQEMTIALSKYKLLLTTLGMSDEALQAYFY